MKLRRSLCRSDSRNESGLTPLHTIYWRMTDKKKWIHFVLKKRSPRMRDEAGVSLSNCCCCYSIRHSIHSHTQFPVSSKTSAQRKDTKTPVLFYSFLSCVSSSFSWWWCFSLWRHPTKKCLTEDWIKNENHSVRFTCRCCCCWRWSSNKNRERKTWECGPEKPDKTGIEGMYTRSLCRSKVSSLLTIDTEESQSRSQNPASLFLFLLHFQLRQGHHLLLFLHEYSFIVSSGQKIHKKHNEEKFKRKKQHTPWHASIRWFTQEDDREDEGEIVWRGHQERDKNITEDLLQRMKIKCVIEGEKQVTCEGHSLLFSITRFHMFNQLWRISLAHRKEHIQSRRRNPLWAEEEQ